MGSQAPKTKNEGEGSRSAARAYDKAATEFANSGKVKPAADEAKTAVESDEGEALREAEAEGKSHARR